MRTSATRTLSATGFLAVFLCAWPARAQYVSTAVTNLNSPSGVAVDTNNNVYIADTQNNRIALFVPTSGTLTTLAGSGRVGTNNGTGTGAGFDQPWGIVAARGGLIVADWGSSLIRYVSFSGSVSNLAGKAFNFGSANGAAASASFSFPTGLAADAVGDIYVADSQNGLVREIDTNNNVSTVQVNNGYTFNLPNALAVDGNGNIWVADSGNDVICMISNGAVTVMAGISGQAGTNDSLVATSAQFNSPSGLFWLTNYTALYISDTGNATIRSLFLTNFNGTTNYGVETVAGLAGLPGFVNGALSLAQFNQPIGLAVDPTDLGFYVADSVNKAIRVLQPTAPEPPVTAPVFGYVTFPPTTTTPVSLFVPNSAAVFNNLTNITVEAEAGTQTFITYGPTGSDIPQPGPGSDTPAVYPGDGSIQSQISSIISPDAGTNDITIYAIGVESGRRSSPVVSARFQFITANPSIDGNNAADIQLNDITQGAQLYYTLNYGTNLATPTNDGSSLGPVSAGAVLSLNITNTATLLVRAFASGLATSSVASEQLSVSNDIGNQMSFGFANGEASSEFIGAAGERFLAPVTLSLLSGATMYALQFSALVTNGTGPELTNFSARFDSMLKIGPPPLLETIYPGIVTNAGTNYTVSTGVLTNVSENLLEIAWIEDYPQTNLYNTTDQYLIQYSQAHDNVFLAQSGEVIVGAYSFVIPSNAPANSTYTLTLLRPSATTFNTPLTAPIGVFVQAPTNGSLTNGAINSIKTVTVGSVPYLVGDGYPFRWFNAGDFGDGVLLNDDVLEVFQSAVYQVNTPPSGSDYFNALDSSNGSDNDFYDGNDTTINSITNGDGALAVDDVYVTLRRSLDPGLLWYDRYWSNGVRYAVAVPNALVAGAPPMPPTLPFKASLGGQRSITVSADQVQTGGGRTAQVPIRVLAADATYPVRVMMINVEIDPLDGSPAITNAISFSAVTNLGSPYTSGSQGANNYAAAWLNSSNAGVSGTNIIGTLTVTLPPSVTSNSAYLVHFNHFSASPNGIALFHPTIQDGLITVGNRTGSSWHDGIPDTWRLLYFGTVSNMLSAANADPDGDGASNWNEYIAGTNPLEAASVFKFAASAQPTGGYFTLQWPSVVNKIYSVQSSSSPAGSWTTMASNLIGNSQTLQWTDTNTSTSARFYRAWVQ